MGPNLSSQFPALRLTVARQMEGYQERIAQRIRRESAKRAERPADLAYALGTHPSTVERWLRAERFPQRRHREELAKHWGLALDTFEFDLEAEEDEVREQLNRIEEKLNSLLEHAGLPIAPIVNADPEELHSATADLEAETERHEGSERANGTAEAGG